VVVHLSASTRYAADPTFKYQVAEVEELSGKLGDDGMR
jgi:hypothetical protein